MKVKPWIPDQLVKDMGFWFDCGDVTTHRVDEHGNTFARCKAGSGQECGPLSRDEDGRWFFEKKCDAD